MSVYIFTKQTAIISTAPKLPIVCRTSPQKLPAIACNRQIGMQLITNELQQKTQN
jgi:hypothetical protein